MTRPKDKGTAFETAVARYLRDAMGDERIERRALHGARDMGDLFGLRAHGHEGIVECKAHKEVGPALLASWRDQTLIERGNADADFAVLAVKVHRAPIAECRAHVTLRDLFRVAGGHFSVARFGADACDEAWVSMTMRELCALMLAPTGGAA